MWSAPTAECFPGKFGNHLFRGIARNQQVFLEGTFCSGVKGDENVVTPFPEVADCIGIQPALDRTLVIDSAIPVPVRAGLPFFRGDPINLARLSYDQYRMIIGEILPVLGSGETKSLKAIAAILVSAAVLAAIFGMFVHLYLSFGHFSKHPKFPGLEFFHLLRSRAGTVRGIIRDAGETGVFLLFQQINRFTNNFRVQLIGKAIVVHQA